LFEPLKKRIEQDGLNLGNGILKVDPFINHQVDPILMEACGQALAELFKSTYPSKILTAEISGIAPALMTAKFLRVPVVYARKHKPITMSNNVYLTVAPSHTKGNVTELIVSPEYLPHGERVLIIDDFLASGATIAGLVRLTQTAGATLVGIGTLIEKAFEEGRDMLSFLNIPIHALVSIVSMDDGQIIFSEE
jgi:xanthine phosphoribosyltransferase